jgi:predicted esterase
MTRRGFFTLGAAGAAAWLHGRVVHAQAAPSAGPGTPPFGESRLGISSDGRDGVLYVPKSYNESTPVPLLVMLHGFAGWADEMKSTFALAEEFGVVVIAPESRALTWGQAAPGFDPDVKFISAAYKKVTNVINVDPDRVALGGRSDGAGYALSMGLAYGDIFNHIIVFSGGMMNTIRRKGMPRVFIAHGTDDRQMPIELTGRQYAETLKAEGYDVTYREYQGGHGTPPAVSREAFRWLVGVKE